MALVAIFHFPGFRVDMSFSHLTADPQQCSHTALVILSEVLRNPELNSVSICVPAV